MRKHHKSWDYFEKRRVRSQLPLLWSLGHEAHQSENDLHGLLFPMLDAVSGSIESLLILARKDRIREMYAVSRMAYETSLNICFILAKGPDAATRAKRHAEQKAIRDLRRSVQFGDEILHLTHSAADEVLSDPRNQALLAEFALKNGAEDRNWTPENINQRLKIVRDKFGRPDSAGFAWSQFLYRHSSEMLHGTLFSALLAYGATEINGPPKTVGELRKRRREQARLILYLTGVFLDSLIRILAGEMKRADISKKAKLAYSRGRLTIG